LTPLLIGSVMPALQRWINTLFVKFVTLLCEGHWCCQTHSFPLTCVGSRNLCANQSDNLKSTHLRSKEHWDQYRGSNVTVYRHSHVRTGSHTIDNLTFWTLMGQQRIELMMWRAPTRNCMQYPSLKITRKFIYIYIYIYTGLEKRDYGRRGSAALTMRHPSIRKSWH
jgi:hypothetical protein